MSKPEFEVEIAELAGRPAIHRKNRRYPEPRVSGEKSAAQMIGTIEHGEEITGITNGQFSLIHLLAHILDEIGPADVAISTWTMGIYDSAQCQEWVLNERIRSIRFILDPSMFGRRVELSGRLLEAFGVDAFRAVNTHAKFATLGNDDFKITVRTSMNLNPNHRLENFDISEGPELYDYFVGLIDEIFERFPVGGEETTQSTRYFSQILAEHEGPARGAVDGLPAVVAGEEADVGAILEAIGNS